MPTQAEKAESFRALHARKGAFVIPNPWDVGSARLLAALGFEALATTSSGFAYALGRLDGKVTRTETIEHCRTLSAATDLPVSADLEKCFADDPETAAETILLAAEAGVVGGSIEDYSGDASRPIYEFELAVERVQAAAEVAKSFDFPFTLTWRMPPSGFSVAGAAGNQVYVAVGYRLTRGFAVVHADVETLY